MIKEFSLYFLSAFFEILGCYSFWSYFRLEKSYLYLGIGFFSLVSFAYLLTRVNLEFAGRAYAVYGGIYIVSSLSIKTCLEIFLMIFSSFSKSLSPEPPIDSTIILLNLSEIFEELLL